MITRLGQADATGKRVRTIHITVTKDTPLKNKNCAYYTSENGHSLLVKYRYLTPRQIDKIILKYRPLTTARTEIFDSFVAKTVTMKFSI